MAQITSKMYGQLRMIAKDCSMGKMLKAAGLRTNLMIEFE